MFIAVGYCYLQFVIVNELVGRMVDCVMHQNGNHVIQRCITNVSPSQLDLIVNAFVGNVSHHNNSKGVRHAALTLLLFVPYRCTCSLSTPLVVESCSVFWRIALEHRWK